MNIKNQEHIMKKYLSISIASILALSAPGIAKAQLYVTANIGGVPTVSGATLENFDEPSPSILTLSGNAWLFTGFTSQGTPPYFSGATAAYFGESPAVGFDNSQYVAVNGGTATLSFSTPQNYFGILCGTIDAPNRLTFYDGANNVIGTVLGSDIPGITLGSGLPSDTSYVNITSTIPFSKVVADNVGDSFEFDDVAYTLVVPEPASSVLFSAGLCILGFVLRRKSA
jgi:hypothetical protein